MNNEMVLEKGLTPAGEVVLLKKFVGTMLRIYAWVGLVLLLVGGLVGSVLTYMFVK